MHSNTIQITHQQFKHHTPFHINLLMKEDEFIQRWTKLQSNNIPYDPSYYGFYLYLISEDGTMFEFPKADYKFGDFARLHKTLSIPPTTHPARTLRRLSVKLRLILLSKIEQTMIEQREHLIKELVSSPVSKQMMRIEKEEEQVYTNLELNSSWCSRVVAVVEKAVNDHL